MTSHRRVLPPRRSGAARRCCLFIAALLALFIAAGPNLSWADSTLSAEVRDVIGRLDEVNRRGGHSAGILSDKDRAVLFANNDAINAARLNNEIPNSVYQAAQSDFDQLNQRFAREAANAAGAEFTVQQRTSQTFSPGTDSDYITVVQSKDQIKQMQGGYNSRVNEFLKQSGAPVPTRDNWHNKLDTDFMADPRVVTDPAEFREIGKMNNDAYKNRFAAEYERISRAKDGSKIGPQHVSGYTEEMNAFAQKKGSKIEDLLGKGPGYFSDPAHRAEIFRTMAQEQKYTSRLESLDDFLRKQEGLPPRNRGTTIAELGSKRSPHNVAAIREAHAAADASRLGAMEDLAETMGQVAKKNPAFNPDMADDIAKILEGLPADRRAGVLARIRSNSGPGLVDDILHASARAGRLSPGSASLADDLARAGGSADDAARAASKLDDLAKSGFGHKRLAAAADALDALGKAATAADVALAAGQLKDYFEKMERALDPATPKDEAQALLEEAQELRKSLAETGALTALVERYPAVAAIYGAWTVACAAGEWMSPTPEADALLRGSSLPRTCLDRHISAWDSARDWWSGKTEERAEHVRSLCGKFMKAVREKRVTLRGDFTVMDVCEALKRGEGIGDMIRTADASPGDIPGEDPPPEVPLAAPTCDQRRNADIVSGLRAAAASGSQAAMAHIARLESINARISAAQSAYAAARETYSEGDMSAARSQLQQSKSAIDELGGTPDCSELAGKIAEGLSRADRMEQILTEARGAAERCDGAELETLRERYGSVHNTGLQSLLAQIEAISLANARYERAKEEFSAGQLAQTRASLVAARGSLSSARLPGCADLAGKLTDGIARVDKLEDAIHAGQQAVDACDASAITRWQTAFAKVSNPAAGAIKAALGNAIGLCKDREREVAEARAREAVEQRQATCIKDYGPGYVVGHVLEDGRFFCQPTQAAADAWCVARNGQGHVATNIDSRGGFACLPGKKTADAWCNANNPGSGWYAGPIRADGSYDCLLSQAGQRAAAEADCRRQHGDRLIRVYKRNGQYWCEHQTVAKGGNRRRPPTYDPSAAAAAVAAAVAAVQAAKQRNRPQRRCHKNPYTGQVHCGSN
ncbi:MAG: hypothetical protein KJZ80_00695 [Hyphomicrobiaceae bacterium]|nr:hypothetical protein [Hyphomicrobiaceae bacterium]